MMAGVTAAGLATTSVVAAASTTPDPVPWLILAAGIAGAVTALWKFLHLSEILRDIRNLLRLSNLQASFLQDWNGEPARPGKEGVPSVPERLNLVERRTAALNHTFAGEMTSRLTLIADDLTEVKSQSRANFDALARLDDRVTDHRRRNEEQSSILRAELERRAQDLENKLNERNRIVDNRLDHISDDLLRAETMRSALVELGLDIERRPPT